MRSITVSKVVVGAMCIGILSCAAQALAIRPAVELSFPTDNNTGYELLSSSNLQTWERQGHQVFGTGGEYSAFYAANSAQAFFKTESFPLRDLTGIVEQIRTSRNVAAVGCAVVLSNRIVGLGASGFRKWNISNAPVTTADKWHHGSLTKSMTATLAAILVKEGRIQWTNTLADVFPDFTNRMAAGYRSATLEQLTSNRGGAPGTMSSGLWNYLWNFEGTPLQARRQLLERLTTNAPASTPGTRYEYSNAGFALAGHMLETVMGKSWETLLTEKLFVPLGMASAGFGVPATPRHINHPWGHTLANPRLPPGAANAVTPIAPGPNSDNPPAIGPAGTVHSSLSDLALYCAFHLAVHHRDTRLLSRDAGRKLHSAYPDNSNYAHGWIVTPRPWANGEALTHAGSNQQWFSVIWLAPAREFAAVAVCNMGGDNASATTDEIIGRMIQEFLD